MVGQRDLTVIYVTVFCLHFPSFIVSGLTFRSLIYFCVVLGSVLISFLHVAVQFSQNHLLKKLSFLHCIVYSFVKDKVPMGVSVYLWAFYLDPLVYISLFVPIPYCLDYSGFVVCYEGSKVDSSSSIFLS